MREDEINGFLGEIVKRGAGWNNIPEKGMILLNLCFFVGRTRLTKEHMRFGISIEVVFKGGNVAELAAVVREQQRSNLSEIKAEGFQFHFEVPDFMCNLGCRFVFKKNADHKIAVDKVDRQYDLAANPSDNGIQLD